LLLTMAGVTNTTSFGSEFCSVRGLGLVLIIKAYVHLFDVFKVTLLKCVCYSDLMKLTFTLIYLSVLEQPMQVLGGG